MSIMRPEPYQPIGWEKRSDTHAAQAATDPFFAGGVPLRRKPPTASQKPRLQTGAPIKTAVISSRHQNGFGLVAALFLIVIIAGVIAAMARMSVTQNATTSLAIQQARAYQAARAGIEYGIARSLDSGKACEAFRLDGFSVSVTCESTPSENLPEEDQAVTFFSIVSRAEHPVRDSPDYAYRQLSAVLETEN